MRVNRAFRLAEEVQNPELPLYRKRTIALLHKYFRMSMELGHLPSLLGREFFRSHVSSYSTHTFEDAVIFVHDMDRALELLPEEWKKVIARLYFQEYTMEEAASQEGCAVTTFLRRREDALKAITAILLHRKMLEPMRVLEYEEEQTASMEDEDEGLPPKKPVKTIRDIRAVAVLA